MEYFILLSLFFIQYIFFIYLSDFYIIFVYTNLPCFVKRPRAIVIVWALYKYFYYYIIISIASRAARQLSK